MRTFLFPIMLHLTVGCAKHVIRDPDVYQSEVEFLSDAGVEVAELLLSEALSQDDTDAGDAKCEELADVALVVLTRSPYHASMMLHLGNLGDDPGEPPTIPTTEAVCSTRATAEEG